MEWEKNGWKEKPYRGLGKSFFLPRYAIPLIIRLDNGLLFEATTGSFDPLHYHHWNGGAHFRTDDQFVGGFLGYTYRRLPVWMGTNLNRYSVDFGNILFASTTGRLVHYFEQRHGGSVFLAYPRGASNYSLSYFYERREPLTDLVPDESSRLNLGGYAGTGLTYTYRDVSMYPASISWEEGRRVRLTSILTHSALGASSVNEQRVFSGDWREYIDLFNTRQVLALRVAGGTTWGDELVQGNFTLGGALGEFPYQQGTNAFYFPLRGVPFAFGSGSRVMLMSAEYRFPIVSPQHSFLVSPIFLKNVHGALFADYGDVWRKSSGRSWDNFFDLFMLGVGSEVRADFVINPGFPSFMRLGYGILVRNRGRVTGLSDSLSKADLKYGTIILQTGIAF